MSMLLGHVMQVLCYMVCSPVLWVPCQQSFQEADRSEDRGDKVSTIYLDRAFFYYCHLGPGTCGKGGPSSRP